MILRESDNRGAKAREVVKHLLHRQKKKFEALERVKVWMGEVRD